MTQPAGRGELFRALAALAEPPEPGHAAIATALGLPGAPGGGDYAEAFLFAAYPYASVYLGAEGMVGGEARDRVAGFWRALGLVPPPEPDHLASLLGLYASLSEAVDGREGGGDHQAGGREASGREASGREASAGGDARAVLDEQARAALLWEHLVPWLPSWLDAVATLAPPLYAAWARLLAMALEAEAGRIPPPGRLPLHLREAPGLPDPGAPSAEWIAALLAPVRSGLLLARPDLGRGAASAGVGVRAGGRAFMLRSMLEQDAEATAGWLIGEAAGWAERHRRVAAWTGEVGRFWVARAEATAAALRALRPAASARR